jgi:hypothetical protein
MLYALLCYNDEDTVWSMSKDDDAAMMARIAVVEDRLTKTGKLGPSLRLFPTTSATTVRNAADAPLVIDGPFAETKEQLLGFFIIDVANLEEAIEAVREIAGAKTGSTYEIRPIAVYFPDKREPDKREAVKV